MTSHLEIKGKFPANGRKNSQRMEERLLLAITKGPDGSAGGNAGENAVPNGSAGLAYPGKATGAGSRGFVSFALDGPETGTVAGLSTGSGFQGNMSADGCGASSALVPRTTGGINSFRRDINDRRQDASRSDRSFDGYRPRTLYSQGLPQINHFTGSPNEERTFADWFDMMRRSIPDFYELDEYQRWNHVASRLKGAALDYWLGIEKYTRCTFDEAVEAMIQMYKDRSDPATRLHKLTAMTMKPGQDLKEFLITQIAYMRRKTPAYEMDATCGTRICANILFNSLPPHLKAPLIRFRSEGTTEELAAAAIELEEAMQGAKEEKQKAKNRAGRGFFNKGGKDGGESPNQNRRPFNSFNRGFQRGSPVNRTDVKTMRSINVADLEIGEVKAESDAAVQKAMDGHLKIMVRAGVRYVQLGNKIFASGQFRTLCYLYERCFACGKKHRIADCPTKDDPLFPNLIKDGLPRQGPNNTGQPVRPWVRLTGNRNNKPEETAQINMQEEDEEELLPDGDYMYQSPTCNVVGNGSSGIPSDAGDAPEILSALPQTEDDFYFRSAEAYDLEVAAIEVIPLTLPQDGPTRFDLLPVADAPPLLSEFRGIPSENFRVGEIPIHGIDVNNPELFKNEETAGSVKLTVAPETKSFGTNTEEVIMISEDAKIPGSTSSDVVVDDVPTTSVMADVGEIEVTSDLPTDQNEADEAKVMWSTGEVIEDRMGEVPIDWTEAVDATKGRRSVQSG